MAAGLLLPFLWMYRGRVLLALSFLVLAKVAAHWMITGLPLLLVLERWGLSYF